ncbi:MAG TPA: ABC transporter permease subunit, partial [Microbacterium sp.]|nr:ABC transporter permease subunit [Microbacterium sp.]
MTITASPAPASAPAAPAAPHRSITAGHLPAWVPWGLLAASLAISVALFGTVAVAAGEGLNYGGWLVVSALLYLLLISVISAIVEGRRRATDRFVTGLVTGAFLIAMVPLISVAYTVISYGVARFDAMFFTNSMRNVVGEGGGALHAIIGTILITFAAAVISIPIGLFTAIYLVEYGRGALARGITFLVDVMTGIPSIVAGLFAYALFALFFGPGIRMGFMGSVALAVLMIPVVVRSSEEMLKLVPNELREASLALGVPKWLT